MWISEIRSETKGRCRVCTREAGDFLLYQGEIRQFGLEAGTELTEEVYEAILEQVIVPRAKKYAMHILEKMDQTEWQLRQKLERVGYPLEAVEEAIEYVVSFHYLDDRRFCKNYIRCYQDSRSRLRISRDLAAKGVERDLVQRCMEEEYEASERDLMRALLVKKGYGDRESTPREREKMYRFLLQRGFPAQDIWSVLREDYRADDCLY